MIKHGILCLVALFVLYEGVQASYKLNEFKQTSNSFTGKLSLLTAGPYGADIQNLNLDAYYVNEDILRIKITSAEGPRWEVPNVYFPGPAFSGKPKFNVNFTQANFGFKVTRGSDTVFDTNGAGLIFEDQFLQISTALPANPNIYGLGERVGSFKLNPGTYTMWAKDHGTPVGPNLYGQHPFYIDQRPSGKAYGAFLLNSNAMDAVLTSNSLTFKTIGGIIDLFIYSGDSALDVVAQHMQIVGNPYMPPYWSLGWHQCRWGYHTVEDDIHMVGNYSANGIPLDTAWNDLDYMDGNRDFSWDPSRFPTAKYQAFVKNLHDNGQHYVTIVDPAIAYQSGYAPYDSGLKAGVFIMKPDNSGPLVGKVWPGATVYPDFMKAQTPEWWYEQVKAFHDNGPAIDGMWIDMNEPSNFCDGSCAIPSVSDDPKFNPNSPPYVPGGVSLKAATVDLAARQNDTICYNTHGLYGWSEGIASKLAMEKLRGTRSMIISRSTFAGSGRHNGHWLGDNDSNYNDMHYSIAGVLDMQIFGINLVGADICGFAGDTTPELCARWIELGSFYPFARSHNSINQKSQEPYALGPVTMQAAIAALKNRYSILPYFYTLFFLAHTQGNTLIWQPLFFQFPTDTQTYANDKQFLVGDSLLVSPVLTQGATSVSAYIPKAVWYDWYTGSLASDGTKAGAYVTLNAPLTYIPCHIRGGSIIPNQAPELTTTKTRKNPITLTIALNTDGSAKGSLFWDDGESLTSISQKQYSYVTFSVTRDSAGLQTLQSKIVNSFNSGASISKLVVYGVDKAPTKATVNTASATINYNSSTKVATISGFQVSLNTALQALWS